MRFDPSIATTNWLKHRWDFEIRENIDQGTRWHEVRVGPLMLSRHETRDLAQGWINRTRPVSLATMLAEHPEFKGGEVVIEGGGGRLGRIPPRLWPTYDAIYVARTAQHLTLLSAKARAMFPDDQTVFVRARPR